MSELPRRRLLDRMRSSPSLLAQEVRLTGDIETSGPLLLSGHVRGNGRIGGELGVASGAHWEGDVVARSAVISGQITGTLVVEEKLEIGASAVIRGRVQARSLAIARGASIEGEMAVTGSEPVVQFEEKRARP
jgi:cytoskeletal protein CcmA (bactofilin family)